jgi:hypothetical protein
MWHSHLNFGGGILLLAFALILLVAIISKEGSK